MTNSNLPAVMRNVLGALTVEDAHEAFIWAATTQDASALKYPAEIYARQLEQVVGLLDGALPIAMRAYPQASGETALDLKRFIIKRHANAYWGGNVTMWWE